MGHKKYDHNGVITQNEKLEKQIESQREKLHNVIEQSENIKSEKILIESQKLDELLIEYEKFKNK